MGLPYEWEKSGVNYWENEECPTEYLQEALMGLVAEVEGVILQYSDVSEMSRGELILEIERFEYLVDK